MASPRHFLQDVTICSASSYLISGLFLGQEEHHRVRDDGVDAKEQVDADVNDKGHSCFLEDPGQQIHP